MDNSRKIQMITTTQEVLGEYESIKSIVKLHFKGLKSAERTIQKLCSGARKAPLIVNGKEVFFRYLV